MFGRQDSRGRNAEQVAGQAWDHLVAAVNSAGSSARVARRRAASLYGDASDRVESSAKEARRRANYAYAALVGREPPRPWRGFAVAAVAGAALGCAATVFAYRLARQSSRFGLPDSFAVDEMVGREATGSR